MAQQIELIRRFRKQDWIPFWQRRQLVHVMVRKLSMLLGSGIQLSESLKLLTSGGGKRRQKAFFKIMHRIQKSIVSGKSFYESLNKYPKWFSPMMVALVRVGEESGRLWKVIQELLQYLDRQEKYSKKLSSVIVYPIVVICVAIITVVFLIIFLLPTFSTMYADMGMELPTFTKILLKISESFGTVILSILTLSGLGFMAIKWLSGNKWFQSLMVRSLRSLPVIRNLFNRILIVYYLQIMITLQESGLTLLRSLEVCRSIAKHPFTMGLFDYIIRHFKEGQSFSNLVARTKLLEPEYTHMIAISENTGELTTSFKHIRDTLNSEVESKLEGLSAIIEPMIIVGLGIIVGLILVGLYLPIFELSSTTAF